MKNIYRFALYLITFTLLSTAVMADNKAIIKHRHGVMEAMGGHFGATYAALGKMEQLDIDKAFHANAIARLAKISAKTFPTGSGSGKTKAMAEIWENPEEFKLAMDKLIRRADEFAEAASGASPTAYAAAAKALGKACKSCHDNYKED